MSKRPAGSSARVPRSFHLPRLAGVRESTPSRVVEFHGSAVRAMNIDGPFVRRVLQGLERKASAGLARLAHRDVVESLDRTFRRWRDRKQPAVRQAVSLLRRICGYSAPMARELVRITFRQLDGEVVQRWWAQHAGAREGGASAARGPSPLFAILGGVIPNVTVVTAIASLLARCAVLFKASSRDPVFPALWCRTLFETEPEVGSAMAALWWPGGTEAIERGALSRARHVVVYGEDRSVEAVRGWLPAPVGLSPYHDRVSFAAIARDKCVADGMEDLADRLAYDACLYEQQGCLSPHWATVEKGGEVRPEEFAERVSDAMQRMAGRLPRGRLLPGEAARVQAARAAFRAKSRTKGRTFLRESSGALNWTVGYEEDPAPCLPCGHRFLVVKGVSSLSEAWRKLKPFRTHLSAVGLEAGSPRRERLAGALFRLGVSRVCRVGRMQTPRLDWPQDGRPLLAELMRWHQREP